MSPRTRRRIVAALVVVVAAIALLREHDRATAPSATSATANRATVPANAARPDSYTGRSWRSPAPTLTTIRADDHQAASDWLRRAQGNISARYWSKFGAENIQLMRLPPAQAWQALTARADNGDVRAAAAAMLIALECQATKTVDSYPRRKLRGDQKVRGLPAHWAAFVRDVDAQLYRYREARANSCKNVGGILDFAMLAFDRFMQRDDPRMQLAEVGEIRNDEDAIAELRHLSTKLGTEQARRELGERLLHARSPAHQTEGLHLLESLAGHDPYVVYLLADCLRNGCGHFLGNPELAQTWIARDAELGEWFGLTWTIEDFEKQSEPVNALAWALYRQDLTFTGCEQIGFQPSTMRLTPAIRAALRLQQPLDNAQRRQAEAITQAIETRWLARAESAQHCVN